MGNCYFAIVVIVLLGCATTTLSQIELDNSEEFVFEDEHKIERREAGSTLVPLTTTVMPQSPTIPVGARASTLPPDTTNLPPSKTPPKETTTTSQTTFTIDPVITRMATMVDNGIKNVQGTQDATQSRTTVVIVTRNYFNTITIPSLIALVTFVLLVLFCTANLNGCLCRLCGGELSEKPYSPI